MYYVTVIVSQLYNLKEMENLVGTGTVDRIMVDLIPMDCNDEKAWQNISQNR